MRYGSLLRGLVYLIGILLGRHRYWNDVHLERAESITIESDEPVHFQLDGDPGGELPLTLETLKDRLTFVAAPPTQTQPSESSSTNSKTLST
jgi:diacylglycerol kinase family enzyme